MVMVIVSTLYLCLVGRLARKLKQLNKNYSQIHSTELCRPQLLYKSGLLGSQK